MFAPPLARVSTSGKCASRGPGASGSDVGIVVHRACTCSAPGAADGDCQGCREKGSGGSATIQRAVESPGRPLDSGTRLFMESRLGFDFSGVRIHVSSE